MFGMCMCWHLLYKFYYLLIFNKNKETYINFAKLKDVVYIDLGMKYINVYDIKNLNVYLGKKGMDIKYCEAYVKAAMRKDLCRLS